MRERAAGGAASGASLAIIGAQWGDEGKGKIVDLVCDGYDLVVRYQGGNNAGHTVRVGDATYKLQLIPSGILKGKRCVLGNGTVIDPEGLLAEMDALPASCSRKDILISDRAHVVLASHKLLDWAHEAHGGAGAIGTTLRGIGPAYASKVRRAGAVRICDLLDARRLEALLAQQDEAALRELSGLVGEETARAKARTLFPHLCGEGDDGAGARGLFDARKTLAHYLALARRLAPHVRDTGLLVNEAALAGRRILFEGAQGALLDVDHGTYPYVTSSNTTRVGAGPFPTELSDAVGEALASRGREIGTVTGRKRRCGWLDAVALRYVRLLCGFSSLAITKLDVLSGVGTLRICVGYTLDGKPVAGFPADPDVLARCVPAYEQLEGWDEDLSAVRDYDALPRACKAYLARIEGLVGVPVSLVSVGPERTQTISRE